MVRGDAAGEEIELGVLERQRLGIGTCRLHIGEALGGGELGGFLEHLLGQVAGDDAGDMRGEGRCRVPGAGGNVDGLPVALR